MLDQNGRIPTADTLAYFHPSAPFTDADRAAREAMVLTDAGGNARVNFVGTLAVAPVAVIATGRSPRSSARSGSPTTPPRPPPP